MKDIQFQLDGVDYAARVEETAAGHLSVTLNGRTFDVTVPQKKINVPLRANPVATTVLAAANLGPAKPSAQHPVVAPLPGTITQVCVKVGDTVKQGQTLVVMEAMKMANDIVADADGVVTHINVSVGDNVNQGQLLIDFEGTSAPAQPAAATAPVAAQGGTVTAPLPGTIRQLMVNVGDEVKAGDTVLTMEAMKMENNITAETNGRVKSILVKADQQVQQGDSLVVLE